MSDYQHIVHEFEPVYDENSRILILGSLPSVKSREQGFYYGHPRNRFWKIMASVCGEPEPLTIEEKKAMLLRNNIALWDVIYSCDIIGSSDSSIKNVVPTDISRIMDAAAIEKVIVNGQMAGKLYAKWIYSKTRVEAVVLPSTSPANASISLDKLTAIWEKELQIRRL